MSQSESSSDESLDVTSEKFNPLKALYSSKVKLPFPNAKAFDNIAQYVSVSERIAGKRPVTKAGDENEPKPSTSRDEPTVPARRFEKYQAAMAAAAESAPSRVSKTPRNVLIKMENCKPPFTRLWECVQADPPSRIRVVTRQGHRIRGTLDGYVVAFDKHFNLAMRDVTELWYRTALTRKRTPFLGDPEVVPTEGRNTITTAEEDALAKEMAALAVSHQREKLPRIPTEYHDLAQGDQPIAHLAKEGSIRNRPPLSSKSGAGGDDRGRPDRAKANRGRPGRRATSDLSAWRPLPTVYWRPHGKRQECERHIDQLLVRGEHVVFIQFPPKLE